MYKEKRERLLDRDPALREFYSSIQWRRCSKAIKQEAGYVCADCRGVYGPGNEVHHIQVLTPENVSDPDVSLNPDNLVCLCSYCHRLRHKQMQSGRRYRIDPETGDVKTI